MSSFGGFRDERYFKPGTSNWTGDREASSLWLSEHGMDQYGGITGPQARVPWNIAMDVQAAHDRGVWNARNRLGASALNFGQGALGNLQSFRPGGGAAEAAGVYQQLAGTQLARASMLQPLDLLGDLRRHEAHQARKATKKAGTIQAITGLVSAAATLIPGVGPAVGAGLQALGSGLAASQGAGAGQTGTAPPGQRPGFGAAPGMLSGGGADPRAYGQQGQQPNPLMSMGGGGPGGGFMQPGFADAMRAGLGGGGQGSPGGGMTPGSNAASGPGPSSGGSQQERRGGGAQGPGGAGAGGGAGGMAMGPPPVGVNGDFSPVAFAASASQGGMSNPLQPLMETKFRSLVADMLDHDPAWNALDAAIARQAMLRGRAA